MLGIVDERAHSIDARLPEGPTTIVKLASTMDTLVTSPAVLTQYVGYEDSDCLNGAVLRVQDGYRFVEHLPSHHAILATGDLVRRLEVAAQVLELGGREDLDPAGVDRHAERANIAALASSARSAVSASGA